MLGLVAAARRAAVFRCTSLLRYVLTFSRGPAAALLCSVVFRYTSLLGCVLMLGLVPAALMDSSIRYTSLLSYVLTFGPVPDEVSHVADTSSLTPRSSHI